MTPRTTSAEEPRTRPDGDRAPATSTREDADGGDTTPEPAAGHTQAIPTPSGRVDVDDAEAARPTRPDPNTPEPADHRPPAVEPTAGRVRLPLSFRGFGGALPARRLTNRDLARDLDTTDDWITTRTGIRARHRAEDETTTSLAVTAARHALDRAGLTAADLDLIVVATSTPDSPCPPTAARVAGALGANVGAYDVNGACTGFIHALGAATAQLSLDGTRRALVIGADRFLSLIDPADRTTAVLFGDGAGAVLVETIASSNDPTDTATADPAFVDPATDRPSGDASDDPAVVDTSTFHRPEGGILAAHLGGAADGVDILEVPRGRPHLHMDGPELFRRAVRVLTESGRTVLERAGLDGADVDLYLPHQANARIVDAAASRLGIHPDRVVHDMVERANTSAASIPLALESAARERRLRPGHVVLLSAVGAGLGWGSILLRWDDR